MVRSVKLAQSLVWSMVDLHNEIVQHNNLTIKNNMLHWESDESLKIGVCNWNANCFRIHNRRDQDPNKYCSKEVEYFIAIGLHGNFA